MLRYGGEWQSAPTSIQHTERQVEEEEAAEDEAAEEHEEKEGPAVRREMKLRTSRWGLPTFQK